MIETVKEYIESKSSLEGMQTAYFGDRVFFNDHFELHGCVVQRCINTNSSPSLNGAIAKRTAVFKLKK